MEEPDPSPIELSPLIEEEISKLYQEINACDEVNPLENDLVEDGYSPISPNYSPGNNISSIQEVVTISIPAKSIDENDGYDSDNFAQYPPWYSKPGTASLAVDENDGPTSFSIHSPPPSPSFFDKPSADISNKRNAEHLTPLQGVKRKVFKYL